MPFDPHLINAKNNGSIVTSEMEVFFSLCPCRIIAVTGSDGKTTTTTLISELLKGAGYQVHLGGNIGKPLLCELPSISFGDLVVLELSSFQLHSMTCRPQTAVITNISPNHLDKHKDYQDYIDAKRSIFLNQKSDDRLILYADDPVTPYYAAQASGTVSMFSDSCMVESGCICENGLISFVSPGCKEAVMRADEIRIPGKHNIRNMLAAFEAVRYDVPVEICREVASTFPGVPHRLEEVRILNGVRYINDSIASSPTRTIAGLQAMKTKPIVLLGGYDKHLPFDTLGDELCRLSKAVILCGATAQKIENAILHSSCYSELPIYRTDNLEASVRLASSIAEAGDIVLLSPACASFDAFRNFEERGDTFRELVMSL
jgi:UDP-N-acetylmuramoylalanine--D-glutamate ligase